MCLSVETLRRIRLRSKLIAPEQSLDLSSAGIHAMIVRVGKVDPGVKLKTWAVAKGGWHAAYVWEGKPLVVGGGQSLIAALRDLLKRIIDKDW